METQKCSKCKKIKIITEYGKNKDGSRQKTCQDCLLIKKARYKERKTTELQESNPKLPAPKPTQKKKVSFEKSLKDIEASGMSYAEYQYQETLRLVRKKKEEE